MFARFLLVFFLHTTIINSAIKVFTEDVAIFTLDGSHYVETSFFLHNEKNEKEFICRIVNDKFSMGLLSDPKKEEKMYEKENAIMKYTYFFQTQFDLFVFKQGIPGMSTEKLKLASVNRALDIANYREMYHQYLRYKSPASVKQVTEKALSIDRPNPFILQAIVTRLAEIEVEEKKQQKKKLEGGDSLSWTLSQPRIHQISSSSEDDDEVFEEIV